MKTCKDCKWYLPLDKNASRKQKDLAKEAERVSLLPCGFCVRYPPVAGGPLMPGRAGWVVILSDDFCGEFADKITE